MTNFIFWQIHTQLGFLLRLKWIIMEIISDKKKKKSCFVWFNLHIISLGNLCKWLAKEAESLGVEIYPGFAADEMLYDGDNVYGIATKDIRFLFYVMSSH